MTRQFSPITLTGSTAVRSVARTIRRSNVSLLFVGAILRSVDVIQRCCVPAGVKKRKCRSLWLTQKCSTIVYCGCIVATNLSMRASTAYTKYEHSTKHNITCDTTVLCVCRQCSAARHGGADRWPSTARQSKPTIRYDMAVQSGNVAQHDSVARWSSPTRWCRRVPRYSPVAQSSSAARHGGMARKQAWHDLAAQLGSARRLSGETQQ